MPSLAQKSFTHYDVLGITPKAPHEIVVAVYRAWMHALKSHPDLGGNEELAKAINIAYEVLKDPSRRAVYDAQMSSVTSEARRRSHRTEVNAKVAFCIPPDDKWFPAEAVDASSLGLKIWTTQDLYVGMHIAIAFPRCAISAVEAIVRWRQHLGQADIWKYEAGIEFFTPIPDVLKRLACG